MIGLDPQAEFFYIYGWLIEICGCFSAKPENCGEGIFSVENFNGLPNLWLISV